MTKVPNESYSEGMAERLARVEAKVDALDDKITLFVRTASSPEIGFVSSGTLAYFRAEMEKDIVSAKNRADEVLTRLNSRMDVINADHNNRLTRLEDSRLRFAYGLVAVSSGLIVDIIIHLLVGFKL